LVNFVTVTIQNYVWVLRIFRLGTNLGWGFNTQEAKKERPTDWDNLLGPKQLSRIFNTSYTQESRNESENFDLKSEGKRKRVLAISFQQISSSSRNSTSNHQFSFFLSF